MDSATVSKLINDEFKQIRIAESAVRPLVGEIVAMDSATEVYRFALKSAGISTDNIHPSAFPTIVEMLKKEKATQKQSNVNVAMDSNSINSFSTAFPNATKLKRA